MNKLKVGTVAVVVVVAASLAGGLALAAGEGPMTPELAAKREMVRKQQQQRVTPEQRKAAAAALKAERLKVHQAKKAVENLNPGSSNSK